MRAELRTHLKASVPNLSFEFGWHQEGKAYPYATIKDRFTVKEYSHSGPDTLKRISLQIDIWSKSYKQVTELLFATEDALDNFSTDLVIEERSIEDETDLIRGTIKFHIWSNDQ